MEIIFLKLGKPAHRALENAGIATLEQLSEFSEDEIAAFHGIGKKALTILHSQLKENGRSFADKKQKAD